MSAWYVFAAMGFYPVCPGSGEYTLVGPLFERIEIRPSDDAVPFVIDVKNVSPENRYIRSVRLNGKPILDFKITHQDIVRGGRLTIELGQDDRTY